MKHESLHPLGESPSFGWMTTENTTTTTAEIRDNASGTTSISWWGWPDEAQLADFAEQTDRVEQADWTIENSPEYATLYFVS